jgi:hypothetical protein
MPCANQIRPDIVLEDEEHPHLEVADFEGAITEIGYPM